MQIRSKQSWLLLVDWQDKLLPVLDNVADMLTRAAVIAEAAKIIGIDCLATLHCVDKLGCFPKQLDQFISHYIEKTSFAVPVTDLPANLPKQVIISGAEAHICVLQTALSLLETGYQPFVVADAVASRCPTNREYGLARLRDAGCQIVTSEMVLFEWLENAQHKDFRKVLSLVK